MPMIHVDTKVLSVLFNYMNSAASNISLGQEGYKVYVISSGGTPVIRVIWKSIRSNINNLKGIVEDMNELASLKEAEIKAIGPYQQEDTKHIIIDFYMRNRHEDRTRVPEMG